MAHSDGRNCRLGALRFHGALQFLTPNFLFRFLEVRDGWVTSLLASRGQQSPAPSPLNGQITMKDTRNRAYAAVWGHDLWIYPNKDGFQLGLASFSIPLNVASIKSSGKHSFTLITPYKNFRYLIGCLSVCLPVYLHDMTLLYFHPIFACLHCSVFGHAHYLQSVCGFS